MEHPIAASPDVFCVLAQLDLTRKTPINGYAHIDGEKTSKLCITACSLGAELKEIVKHAITLFPGSSNGMAERIHYLLSVTGSRICVSYMNCDKARVFELYQVETTTARIELIGSCAVTVDRHGPTAIMAIGDRCFLGFRNKTAVVNLKAEKLSVDVFHEFEGSSEKSIDAFAYNGGKTLFAIDDMKWPKYAFYYSIDKLEKKKKISLPAGVNEIYEHAVMTEDEIAVMSHYATEAGAGTNIYLLAAAGAVKRAAVLQNYRGSQKGANEARYPRFKALGYLRAGVVLLVAPDQPALYCLHKHDITAGTTRHVPDKVLQVAIGDTCQDVTTVKDKSKGYLLARRKNSSIIAEVAWNNDHVAVLKEHVIDEPYDRVFMEM